MLNGLDLFAGIGGMSIALQQWVRPIAYCEIDPYCQGVLISRMEDKKISLAPVWDDIRSFDGSSWYGGVEIIYGGFPCQGISVAGLGKGLEDERSGLFFEIVRLAKEIQPSYIFLENVPAISTRGGLEIVREVTEMGYDCRWCVISAASIGAPHKRERWFCLGRYPNSKCKNSEQSFSLQRWSQENTKSAGICSDVANTRFICQRCIQEPGKEDRASFHDPRCSRFWEVEPNVDRVADGVFQRVDRIRALGNAVVPEQAKKAFKILMGMMKI